MLSLFEGFQAALILWFEKCALVSGWFVSKLICDCLFLHFFQALELSFSQRSIWNLISLCRIFFLNSFKGELIFLCSSSPLHFFTIVILLKKSGKMLQGDLVNIDGQDKRTISLKPDECSSWVFHFSSLKKGWFDLAAWLFWRQKRNIFEKNF